MRGRNYFTNIIFYFGDKNYEASDYNKNKCIFFSESDFKKRVLKKLISKSSREDMCRLPTSFLLNIQSRVKQEVDMLQIQNWVTGFSILILCAKYQEAGLRGS